MMSKITLTKAIHLMGGWRNRSRNGSSWRYTPLGLILLLSALFVPNIASAITVTTTYDFEAAASAGGATEVSSNTITINRISCTYFSELGNISDPGRFAAQNARSDVRLRTDQNFGLHNYGSGGRLFVISNLKKDEVVKFEASTTLTVANGNASGDNNEYTVSEDGDLAVNLPRGNRITKITINHEYKESWGYDPAIETYDMYNVNQNIQSNNLSDESTGFKLDYNDYDAKYLTNLQSGLALNNRIAISQVEYNGVMTPWKLDHGPQSLYNWHNFSVCNLVEGDRVVITYTKQAKFSSKAENMAYNGCAAFKDWCNNGDYDEGYDTYIECGMALEAQATNWDNQFNENIYTSYPYVITEDGHLDIALPADARVCKVEIFGDHQAQMVDRENNFSSNTAYFNTTGQLEAKQHIVPGGLNVYIGNTDDSQHAEVVLSDQGPVSFVYDQAHFKMARQTYNSTNVWNALPATGTFYKFVPEVSGKMWIKFKANSISYRNFFADDARKAVDSNGTPNEVTNSTTCPYYLMVEQNGSFQQVENPHSYSNGAFGFFGHFKGDPTGDGNGYGIDVERGKAYYLYGWWDDPNNWTDYNNHACGVAELIEVTFLPNQMVEPLAKWVEPKTKSDDDLADVKGYNRVTIKKKSSNIASCEPYIENGKLKIRNITFVDENKGGGTILIKVGDPNIDADPVFAYTIAYDAAYNPSEVGQDINGKTITRSEGHSWNFSDNPLKGLKWNNKNAEADEVVFGPYFNNFFTADKDDNGVPTNGVNSNCFLYEEMNKTGADGSKHSDWTFNYRVKKNTQFLDPRFLNNYDMEGDNADMMWDTEGLIINAGSTQSCIFDEFMLTNDRVIDHSNKTQADPDRYVGFLPGGSFIIPCLKKDDRVIVYMGSGEGSGTTSMELSITNARDAMYEVIDPDDSYHAGGSQWNVPNGHNDPNYRGCYHFFAKEDGDMEFKMVGGSMCKLYSIKIYRGARECTNGVQENSGGYILLAEKDQSGNVTSTETKSWTLHFRGKGEQVADGTGANGQENEVLTSSGNIENKELGILRGGQSNARIGITYTNEGEIGMLRVRVKCMEFNQKYVTDFADRNFTLALHETQSYPYTWDFTDVNRFSGYGVSDNDQNYNNDIKGEYDEYNEITDLESATTWYEPLGRELSMWDEDGGVILKPSTEEYVNQNMIFENSKGIDGNQLWANGKVIPETQGLWFYFDNNDIAYNGSIQLTEEGLRLSNTKRQLANGGYTMGWWNTKMVVPSVPTGAAVYARVKRDNTVKMADEATGSDGRTTAFLWSRFQFITEKHFEKGQDGKDVTIVDVGMPDKVDIADGIKDDNYYECRFYKADDAKTLNAYSANDGSDEYIIAILNKGTQGDLHLTFNGWIVEKLSVSIDEKKLNKYGWATESRERVIDPELTAYLTGQPIKTFIPTSTGIDLGSKKITLEAVYPYSDNVTQGESTYVMNAVQTDGDQNACILYNTNNANTEILKGGFHLFVPDMHDDPAQENSVKGLQPVSESIMKSQLASGKVSMTDGDYTNYVLTISTSKAGWDADSDNWPGYDNEDIGFVGFYRVQPKGVQSKGHQGYVQFLTTDVKPESNGSNFFSIVFGDEDTNSINNMGVSINNAEPTYYNLWGQKLNGVPTQRGIYIINGKKITVK